MNTFILEHMILMLFQCSFFCGWPHDRPDYINSLQMHNMIEHAYKPQIGMNRKL